MQSVVSRFHTWALWALTTVLPLTFSEPLLAQAQLGIIIDDIGYNLALGKRATDLGGDFTLAVLPFTPYGVELAERAHQRGKEIMLHAPMSNHHHQSLGRGGLTSDMQRDQFLTVLRQNLANIPHIKGLNNHMGSELTERAQPMHWLMEELKEQHLYFIDSRTSAHTQALIAAEKSRLPSRKRDVFLDNLRTKDIRQQLILALTLARQQGSAIAIGHPYPETLTELENLGPLLEQFEVTLVKISQLLVPESGGVDSISGGSACAAPPMSLWPSPWVPIDPFDVNLVFKL